VNNKPKVAKHTRTPEEVRAQQKRDAERDHQQVVAAIKPAPLPAKPASNATALPDTRTRVQVYLDEIAAATLVGRMIKFGKGGEFETPDDGEKIGDDVDFIALCDQVLIGYTKFNGEGNPPDRAMGLLYDGFALPPRESLGNNDPSQWELGLDGQPADPWVHQVCLPLQRGDSGEMFTYISSSKTGRRAIGNLLRHYERLEKARSNAYPIIRLKVGGFNHRDDRIGWVAVPVLAVVGRQPKDSAAKPDTSIATDLNDQLPF
jgi:hypothetical protein